MVSPHLSLIYRSAFITEEESGGGADSCSQSKLQWQKVLSSPNLWTDMTLVLQ